MLFRKEKKRERDRAVIIVVISDEIFKECVTIKSFLSLIVMGVVRSALVFYCSVGQVLKEFSCL